MLIRNMCLSNIIIGFFSIPFHTTLLKTWSLADILCPLCAVAQVFSSSVTIFSLTAIAVIQYRAIMKPLSANLKKRTIRFLIIEIWIISILIASPVGISRRVIVLHNAQNRSETNDRHVCMNINISDNLMLIYSLFMTFTQYIIPLITMCTIYIRIGLKLWYATLPGNPECSRDQNLHHNKIKTIKMIITIVSVFGISWFPLQLYNIILYFDDSIRMYKHIRLVWFFCDWIAMTNCCSNPFIYAIYNERYAKELRDVYNRIRRMFSDPPPVNEIQMLEL
ncbi:PREDICTED: neuropeptide Y receptor-like [Eufriesea mexicana]|uniref:neuropeptide Y receptor-like n=1 Tax=Eufriesea mexicana TaxID=516756 RepID=UPI00083C0FCB|nr:PREDICTED: neuropeptide Y receptor-like [Eufriesea mexicana]